MSIVVPNIVVLLVILVVVLMVVAVVLELVEVVASHHCYLFFENQNHRCDNSN